MTLPSLSSVVAAIENALGLSPETPAPTPTASVPPASASVAGSDLAKFLGALFAWEQTNDPTVQAALSGAQRVATFLAIFDVPGAGAVAAGLGFAEEDIPVIVAVGRTAIPALTALASDATVFAPSDAPKWPGAPNAI